MFCAPFAFYAVNEQIKYRVSAPLLGYLLRCHFNDYLGGIAFAAAGVACIVLTLLLHGFVIFWVIMGATAAATIASVYLSWKYSRE